MGSRADDPSMHDEATKAERANSDAIVARVWADLAVVAHLGAAFIIHHPNTTRDWPPEAEREMAGMLYRSRGAHYGNITSVPEAAFDWPIYRAALDERDLRERHAAHVADGVSWGYCPLCV